MVQEVRDQLLSKKSQFFQIIDDQQPRFELASEFESTKTFLSSFFEILEDDKEFDKKVIQNMRTK